MANTTHPHDIATSSEKKDAKAIAYDSSAPLETFVDQPSAYDEEKSVDYEEKSAGDVSHDPNVVDYDGPDDPDNPLNWSGKKKWTLVALLSALTLTTPLASSMFAPGIPEVLADFNSTQQILGSFAVSVYILGYALGPIVIAPLSEMFGRLPVYHGTNFLFVVFTIACAVSTDLGMLIAFRVFAGMAGSAPLTIGGGSIADMFRQEERGSAMAIWSMGPLLGPVVGPIAGGFISERISWRWVFWIITILAGVILVSFLLFFRETYTPIILQRKATRLQKETGNMDLRAKGDRGESAAQLWMRAIVRPLKLLFLSPIVFLLSLYGAVVYGYLYLLFTTITEVFHNFYGFPLDICGLVYIGIGVGMFIGLIVAGGLSDRVLKKKAAAAGGELKPEYRLPFMLPGSIAMPIGLFIYGWTAQYHVFWIVPIIGTSFVGFSLIGVLIASNTYLVDSFSIHAASVIAANTIIRSLVGALLPLAGPTMYAKLGLGWGNSVLGFIAVALLPIPFLFQRYGEYLRKHFQVSL